MAHLQLLRLLEELSDEELRSFAFFLPELPGRGAHIPRGKLANVSRVQLAELLLKCYPRAELDVAAQVLGLLPRRDLLRKYRLREPGETPRVEAGSPLQELELPVSEKAREEIARPDDFPETAAAPKWVSDKDLMKLAKNLGKEWKAIGIEFLGVATSRLEQIEEENPGNAVMRNFYMLKVWKNCEGVGATPYRLYHILAQEEVPLDRDAIEFLRSS